MKRLQPLMSGYEIVWFKSEFDECYQSAIKWGI